MKTMTFLTLSFFLGAFYLTLSQESFAAFSKPSIYCNVIEFYPQMDSKATLNIKKAGEFSADNLNDEFIANYRLKDENKEIRLKIEVLKSNLFDSFTESHYTVSGPFVYSEKIYSVKLHIASVDGSPIGSKIQGCIPTPISEKTVYTFCHETTTK